MPSLEAGWGVCSGWDLRVGLNQTVGRGGDERRVQQARIEYPTGPARINTTNQARPGLLPSQI